MDDFIKRMQGERDELNERIGKLEKGIVRFGLSNHKRVTLMESQLKAMKDYLFYLEERIHHELSSQTEAMPNEE